MSKNKTTKIKDIKVKNNNMINKIENIDSLIEDIEKAYSTLSDEYCEIYSN